MRKTKWKSPVGLRTLKSVAAVILAMLLVDKFGTTTSKLIFAMLGAMAAMQPTFTESLKSCLTEIVGALFGGLAGALLTLLPVHPLVAAGIGLMLVIVGYNTLHIRFSPSLPCFIVVMVCTTPDVEPMSYALGRIWDTAIGLGVGMLINTLVFPYDNSRQIRAAVVSLDREVLAFLEDMFDGDAYLPNAVKMKKNTRTMFRQLSIFSNQRLLLHRSRQRWELRNFRKCADKARVLLATMEVLSQLGHSGCLDAENRQELERCGAVIRDPRQPEAVQELDVVVNFHVRRILTLRRELLEALDQSATDSE